MLPPFPIYSDLDIVLCNYCNKPITVGACIDVVSLRDDFSMSTLCSAPSTLIQRYDMGLFVRNRTKMSRRLLLSARKDE